ncbi:MAG TPA: DUF4251 domain-containing protein, partial [Chitinophagaceae bacterium]
MKRLHFYGLLASLFILYMPGIANAQKLDAANTKRIVDAKNYVFKAQSVTPSRGSLRQLTSDYDLTVAGDSLIAYLPYFGRAYSAPIDSEGGIKFTSAKSDYRVKQ